MMTIEIDDWGEPTQRKRFLPSAFQVFVMDDHPGCLHSQSLRGVVRGISLASPLVRFPVPALRAPATRAHVLSAWDRNEDRKEIYTSSRKTSHDWGIGRLHLSLGPAPSRLLIQDWFADALFKSTTQHPSMAETGFPDAQWLNGESSHVHPSICNFPDRYMCFHSRHAFLLPFLSSTANLPLLSSYWYYLTSVVHSFHRIISIHSSSAPSRNPTNFQSPNTTNIKMRFSVIAAAVMASVVSAESTIYTTEEITITSCAATVTNCPARSTVVSTTSYPVITASSSSVPVYANTSSAAVYSYTAPTSSTPVVVATSSPLGVASSYPLLSTVTVSTW